MIDRGEPLVSFSAPFPQNHLYLTALHQALEHYVDGGQGIGVVGEIKPFGFHSLFEFTRAQRDKSLFQSDPSQLGQTRCQFHLGSAFLGGSIAEFSAQPLQMADEGWQSGHLFINLLSLPQQVGQLSFAGLQVPTIGG
jgi:hypothetical protein